MKKGMKEFTSQCWKKDHIFLLSCLLQMSLSFKGRKEIIQQINFLVWVAVKGQLQQMKEILRWLQKSRQEKIKRKGIKSSRRYNRPASSPK